MTRTPKTASQSTLTQVVLALGVVAGILGCSVASASPPKSGFLASGTNPNSCMILAVGSWSGSRLTEVRLSVAFNGSTMGPVPIPFKAPYPHSGSASPAFAVSTTGTDAVAHATFVVPSNRQGSAAADSLPFDVTNCAP